MPLCLWSKRLSFLNVALHDVALLEALPASLIPFPTDSHFTRQALPTSFPYTLHAVPHLCSFSPAVFSGLNS